MLPRVAAAAVGPSAGSPSRPRSGLEAAPARALHSTPVQESPVVTAVVGLSLGVTVLSLRYFMEAYSKWAAAPRSRTSSVRRFYRGPFEDEMSRREAALILGIRESAGPDKVRERHRKLLTLNHPDRGGSDLLASKVNEAKSKLLSGE